MDNLGLSLVNNIAVGACIGAISGTFIGGPIGTLGGAAYGAGCGVGSALAIHLTLGSCITTVQNEAQNGDPNFFIITAVTVATLAILLIATVTGGLCALALLGISAPIGTIVVLHLTQSLVSFVAFLGLGCLQRSFQAQPA